VKLFEKVTLTEKDIGQPGKSPTGRSKSTDSVKQKYDMPKDEEDKE
jgi:hypothetical protein